MRPVRLELYNFLAYREPPAVHFEGLHLACLSGQNGAGKSSLLDAITWALWGRARTKNNEDEKLIHLGQEEMRVVFDFRQDTALYRVIRQHSRKRRTSKSTLELLSWDDAMQQWRTIQESESSRETDKQITRLLRLDYETFVNSAFLQQNRADSFAVMTRGQRKEILAEILGLARWSGYEERAKAQLRSIENELERLKITIAEIEQEEGREPEIQDRLQTAMAAQKNAEIALQEAQAHLEKVKDAPLRLSTAQQQADAAARQMRSLQKDIDLTESALNSEESKRTSYQHTIANEAAIREGYERYQNARQVDFEQSGKLKARAAQESRKAEATRRLAVARAEREKTAEALHTNLREAERKLAQTQNAGGELEALHAELANYAQLQAEQERLLNDEKTLIEERSALMTHNKALKDEMDELREAFDKLSASEETLCPYCRRPLDAAHRDHIESEGKARRDTYRVNEKRIKEIAATINGQQSRVKEIEQEQKKTEKLKKQEGVLTERIREGEQLAKRLEADRAKLAALTQELESESYGAELRAVMAEIEREMTELDYDEDAHDAAREALRTLRSFEDQMRQLAIAVEALPGVEAAIENAANRLALHRDQWRDFKDRTTALNAEIEQLKALATEAQQRTATVNRLRIEERHATESVISAQQELKALDRQRQRKIEYIAQQHTLDDERSIYEQLRDAFGKNGVPAMIIEAAIPELEEKANDLLARMTDGRMHVGFKTQKATKGGSVIETLDIEISDELGTRDYDLFSGGEGFRVNFALRIALSQFLARRAGARLQTLVIDEGFGSQDQIGRERLVEAINSIREEFDLILIVTHIEELRDAFPAHIEIQKTASGSTVLVK